MIHKVDSTIDTMTAKHECRISFMRTISGADHNSAITIISENVNDMSQFGASNRLCLPIGLMSDNNESDGKKKSVRFARAEVYLNPALVITDFVPGVL